MAKKDKKSEAVESAPPEGSGPGGKITRDDIRNKLGDLQGGVNEGISGAKPVATYAAVGAGVLIVLIVFMLGRSRGKKQTPVVEIRRK